MAKKKTHGGARKGAGRKPVAEEDRKVTVGFPVGYKNDPLVVKLKTQEFGPEDTTVAPE